MACFTKCCADLNLLLTPYDIVRMKSRLGYSSDVFLEKYTVTTLESHPRFPMVNLKMNKDQGRRCPFVTTSGCAVYEDRPAACRIYPLGRAATKWGGAKDVMQEFFMVEENHCLGLHEEKEWSIDQWLSDQGVDEYNAMNDRWLEIITSRKDLGVKKDVPRKLQMFFMASYNLDKFRDFLFGSKFFDLFEVGEVTRQRLASDDVELMKFAFSWLKFSLFGEETIAIKIPAHRRCC